MTIFLYILREHIAPFCYAFFVITFLFLMDYILSIIDSIFSKGLSVVDVLHMFILNMAWMMALSIPMAVLVAALMAYGRLSSDNEVTALKSAGVHSFKIILPSFLAASVIGLGLIYFNNNILPESNHKAAMLTLDIMQKRPAAYIREGFIIDDFQGYKIVVGRVNQLTGEMRDIKIYQEEQGRVTLTFAKRGDITYINGGRVIRFSLYEGESHREDVQQNGDYFRSEFAKQVVYIDNVDESFRHTSNQERGDREMSSRMMLDKVHGFRRDLAREESTVVAVVKDSGIAAAGVKVKTGEIKTFDFRRINQQDFQRVLNEERRRSMSLVRRRYSLDNARQLISKYMVEVHKKYSIPAACPVFVLIGAPLGILARTSGIGVGVTFSLGFFILYWIFLIGGEWLADAMIVPPWVAMWSPNLLLLVGGIWLFLRMLKEKEFSLLSGLFRRLQEFIKQRRKPGKRVES